MYIALALELKGIIMKPFKFKETEIPNHRVNYSVVYVFMLKSE